MTQSIRRLRGMTWFALFWGAMIAMRLVTLQVKQHAELAKKADERHQIKVPLPAPRGDIVDRDGRILVSSLPTKSLGVLAPRVTDAAKAAALLESLVPSLRGKGLAKKIQDGVDSEVSFIPVKRNLEPEEAAAVENLLRPPERSEKKDKADAKKKEPKPSYSWIDFRDTSRRDHTSGGLAAHVLGSTTLDENETEKGIEGVEKSLEPVLRGVSGHAWMLADSHRRPLDTLRGNPPKPGATVALTIAAPLQRDVESVLAKAVASSGAVSGTIVVMDPRSGDVLAMASYPTFDPSRKPKTKPKPKKEGPDPEWDRRVNLAISGASEAGSVSKLFTFAAALETTRLRPETWINCLGGVITVGGHRISDTHANWSLPMSQVLAVSSNVGTVQLALTMGPRNLHDYLVKFGFGRRTGIELPNESRGRVMEFEEWTRRKYAHASHAIGYGYSSTTLQLAQAVSAIANGGELAPARIVLWKQPSGREREPRTQAPRERILRKETALDMIRMSEGVILRGTGKDAAVEGYHAAGKTGTAKRVEGNHYVGVYNASFAGLAPVNDPRVVVAVTLHRTPHMAAAAAAPAFRQVMAASLRYLGVKPDYEPERKPKREERVDDSGQMLAQAQPQLAPTAAVPAVNVRTSTIGPSVPDLRGMDKREAMQALLALDAPIDFVGKGVVVSQNPPPGAVLAAGQRLQVRFDR